MTPQPPGAAAPGRRPRRGANVASVGRAGAPRGGRTNNDDERAAVRHMGFLAALDEMGITDVHKV